MFLELFCVENSYLQVNVFSAGRKIPKKNRRKSQRFFPFYLQSFLESQESQTNGKWIKRIASGSFPGFE